MASSAKKSSGSRPKEIKVWSDNLGELNKSTLKAANLAPAAWAWHYGKVTGLGFFETAGGREVSILWDGDAASRKQGGITDQQWEIFKLAFKGTGRILVLSDKPAPDWKFDYRFLEAVHQ